MCKKIFILLVAMIFTMLLLGCFSTWVNAPIDTTYVSKTIATSEIGVSNKYSRIIQQDAVTIHKAIQDSLFSRQNESVVRYAYNDITKDYHVNELLYLVSPPDDRKGAYVSSKRSFIGVKRHKKQLILVYITPTDEGTDIRVDVQNRGDVTQTMVLEDILNRLPAPDPNIAPDDTPDVGADDKQQ